MKLTTVLCENTNYDKISVIFTNDNDVSIKTITHDFTNDFRRRNNHEVLFRRINTYLIINNLIDGNIIDLGAWIGDNSIPWALNNNKHKIYAIDPSPHNIEFIKQMMVENNISNITPLQYVISDKCELVSTNGNINHCSFDKNDNGNTVLQSETLDHLYSEKVIDNISYIHLDVEGFEWNVINGAINVIERYKPIISYEQHLDIDDYNGLSHCLFNRGYDIYLVNEILPGCRTDCRNLFAIPCNMDININDINTYIGSPVLLNMYRHQNNFTNISKYVGCMFGEYFNKMEYIVHSVTYGDINIFCVNDDNHTKIIAVDGNKNWMCGKYLHGLVNTQCVQTVIDAYLSAQGNVTKKQYNIKIL